VSHDRLSGPSDANARRFEPHCPSQTGLGQVDW
jgi:hypothetical protein